MSTCGKKLAPGQWWVSCGETDMGQTAPVQCVECAKYGFLLVGATVAEVEAQDRKRREAMDRWKGSCFMGRLEDY